MIMSLESGVHLTPDKQTYIVLGRLDEVTHDGEEEGLGDGGVQPSVEARTTEDSSSDD